MAKIDFNQLSDYATNVDLERDGVWTPDLGKGFKIKLRRAGGSNRKFGEMLRRTIKPYEKRRGGIRDIDPDVSDELMAKVYAKTIVADWEGLHTLDGQEVPCTVENILDVFDYARELFREVQDFASDPANYGVNEIEEAAETLGED